MSTSTSSLTVTDPGGISVFNRGPLISVFAPPATCLSTLTYIAELYFGHYDNYFDRACLPTSRSSSQIPQSQSNSWDLYYYSPGQCPSGWSHATTLSSYFPGALSRALSLGVDTTAVVCCPSGYAYPTSGLGHQCESSIISGATLTYFSPTLSQNSYVQGSASTTTVGTGLYIIYGDGIPVWWQSSDLAAFAAGSPIPSSLSSSAPTTNTASSSPTGSTPPTTGTSSPSSSDPGSSGLSTGAKAAIGVCIPLAFIALLLGLFYCFRYRPRKAQHCEVPPGGENFRDIDMNDISKVQTPSDHVQELPNERPVVEIGSNDRTSHPRIDYHELPSTSLS